jgi:hypothetical protein
LSPNFNPLIIPYQPFCNSSLVSFGVVPNDLDDIFLPIRTSNKFRRTSKDKVVFVGAERGGFGVNCNNTKIHKSKLCIDDDDDSHVDVNNDSNVDDHMDDTSTSHNGSSTHIGVDDEDSFSHISDSQSGISIPSIRMAIQIHSST